MTPPLGDVRHPGIVVQLSGEDGNAFSMLARVRKAMRRAGVEQSEIDRFADEAMSGDYDHLIQTILRTVTTT